MTEGIASESDSPEAAAAASDGWVRRWLHRLEVDPAVAYAVVARAWQVLAGPVSLFVLVRFFSKAEQGLYYMFANLVLWHGFVELGLQSVITIIASHEWAELEVDASGAVVGSESARRRLASLSTSTFRWYAGVSFLFSIVIGGCGYWLLAREDPGDIVWRGPWLLVVVLTAPSIWLSSQVALLEGCNQLGTINRFRCLQGVVGNLAVWAAIAAGTGLWATVASAAVRLGWDAWLVLRTYDRFFKSLPFADAGDDCSWRDEVWPLQWRMAVRSLFAHLGAPLLLPVVFAYRGREVSGLVGMTLTILQAVEASAYAWMQTRAPRLGMSAARRDFANLDRLFWRVGGISTAVLTLGGGLVCGIVAALPSIPLELAQKLAGRMADVRTTLLLVGGMIAYHLVRCLGVYVYVHKRDPFVVPQIICSSCLGLCIWLFGRSWGESGVAFGYLIGNAGAFLPVWTWLFLHCRREWH